MELKKGYKLTEVGIIPDDWEVKKIKEVSHVKTGPFGSTLHEKDYVQEGTPIITVEHLGERRVLHSNLPMVSDSDRKRLSAYELKIGDIVFSRVGSVDRNSLVRKEENGWLFSGRLLRIRLNLGGVNSAYLSHYFNQEPFKQSVRKVAVGQTMPSLNTQILNEIVLAFPYNLAEQTAIATTLSDADALITALEKLIAKKRLIKQGAMQKLLKPKIGWEVKSLHELSENKKELFDDGDWIESEHITENGVRLIQTGNIGIGRYVEKENKKYIFESSFIKLKCKPLIEGDLLICRLADPAGRACVLPNIEEAKVITSVDVTIFRPKSELGNRVFLANYFSTTKWFQQVIERVGGTTHKRISRSSLGKIEIIIPKIEEQNAIAQILSDMDTEIERLEKKLAKYRLLKQGMMQNLLTGKIRLV